MAWATFSVFALICVEPAAAQTAGSEGALDGSLANSAAASDSEAGEVDAPEDREFDMEDPSAEGAVVIPEPGAGGQEPGVVIPEPPGQSGYSVAGQPMLGTPQLQIRQDINPWFESYWSGLVGSALGLLGSALMVGIAVNSDVSGGDGYVLAIVLASSVPVLVWVGTAAGVSWHGRRMGGQGRFGAAFGGAVLGSVVAGAVTSLVASAGGEDAVGAALPTVATISFAAAIPLFSSWAYWRNSRKSASRTAARAEPHLQPGYAWFPDIRVSADSAYVGVASAF